MYINIYINDVRVLNQQLTKVLSPHGIIDTLIGSDIHLDLIVKDGDAEYEPESITVDEDPAELRSTVIVQIKKAQQVVLPKEYLDDPRIGQ